MTMRELRRTILCIIHGNCLAEFHDTTTPKVYAAYNALPDVFPIDPKPWGCGLHRGHKGPHVAYVPSGQAIAVEGQPYPIEEAAR